MKDKVVIVTGAASGIGKACAARFAADGAALVLADRDDVEEGAAAIEASGGQALAVSVDVSDEDSVANLFAATADRFGRLDVLAHLAGVAPSCNTSVAATALRNWGNSRTPRFGTSLAFSRPINRHGRNQGACIQVRA